MSKQTSSAQAEAKELKQYVRYYNQSLPRAKGIKALQSPSIYIIAVIVAFMLYHLDRRYPFHNLLISTQDDLKDFKIDFSQDEETPIAPIFVFIMSLAILCLVLAVKRVKNRREAASKEEETTVVEEENTIKDPIAEYIDSRYGGNQLLGLRPRQPVVGCEKITQDEFDYQSQLYTKKEIQKLVKSDVYQKAVKAKGTDPAAWNWQASDRKEGFLPNEDEKELDENFEIEQEIAKVDEQLKKEGVVLNDRTNKQVVVVRQETAEKSFKIGSPSKRKYMVTPSTGYTLRSSPHITRGQLKML